MADQDGLRVETDNRGVVSLSWPWSFDGDLLRPPVAVSDGSPDVVMLSVRPYPEWRWFTSRRVLLPVARSRRTRYDLVHVLAAVPMKALPIALGMMLVGFCALDSTLPDSMAVTAVVLVMFGLLAFLFAVFFAASILVRRWVVPEYPRLAAGDRVTIDLPHVAFMDEFMRLNKVAVRRPPVDDAFTDRFSAAG